VPTPSLGEPPLTTRRPGSTPTSHTEAKGSGTAGGSTEADPRRRSDVHRRFH